MAAESLLAQIADNPKLPTPPTLTLRILEQASKPSCTLHELSKIISIDAALCGKMLKLVNSSLFGLQRAVTSIDRALNLLGLNHVRSLVLSLSLPSLRFRHASSARMKSYWKSSATMAMACREMAVRRKWPDPDSEMVAGLLCDLGELLLQETFPEKYALVVGDGSERRFKVQCGLETTHVGVDHAEAGAYCFGRWKLPKELTEAIRCHHRPEAAPPDFANRSYLLYFASCIAQMHHAPDQAELLGEIVALARQRFGFSDEQLRSFLEALNGKVDDFAALIDVDFGPSESFSDLFAKATENLTKLVMATSLDNVRVIEEKTQVEQRLHSAKEALQKTEEQLRQAQKMEAIGRLAGGLAHDFNNLLTVIIGNCDLLLELPSVDDEARGMVDLIRQTGDRAAELTRQLLAFSRKQRLVPEVINLNTIVSDMSRMLRRLLGSDIQLVTRLADDLALVTIDPSQLSQVIMNLAVNARDAMPGGGALTIETFNLDLDAHDAPVNSNIQAGRYTVIAVRDSGCGMDKSTLQQIFEPFFTTKDNGKGTGLGLATVHGIVEQSGGAITVTSEVGAGTVFHIYLPVEEQPKPAVVVPPRDSESLHGTETILVAEDQDEVREYARRSLELFGYKVLPARNGRDAIEVSQRTPERIHVLFTDIVMPHVNGRDLVREITRQRSGIKVLLTSGLADDLAGAAGETAITAPFLQKPYTPKILVSKIREVLAAPKP